MKLQDLVWFGRAFVWIGVALLLLMAFSGRDIAPLSTIAVIGTIAGIALLLYAGPWSRRDV